MEEEVGKRAKELDEMEIIHRIRIGNKTIVRLIIAGLIWLCIMFLMYKFL